MALEQLTTRASSPALKDCTRRELWTFSLSAIHNQEHLLHFIGLGATYLSHSQTYKATAKVRCLAAFQLPAALIVP